MQIHRGELTQKKVEDSGLPLARLADRLGVTRRTIYNWFERDDLPLEYMLRVGKVIQYDFKKDLPEFNPSMASEPATAYSPVNWKDKYFEMLEENHRLSTRYIELVEKKLMEYALGLKGVNT